MNFGDVTPSSTPPSLAPTAAENTHTLSSHQNTLALMMLALLQALQVGANGMLAHAQQINQMTQNLNLINNAETAQNLTNIPQVIPGHHGAIKNSVAISNAEALNNEFVKQQADQNLYGTQLQQLMSIQSTSANESNQSLSNVVNQLTYSMQQISDITFSADLTTPPQAL